MAQFELNIYGQDDEIVKTYQTNIVRWGVYLQALEAQDAIKEMSAAKQLEVINGFVKRIFNGLTDAELADADVEDVFNTFCQLVNKAQQIISPKNG